MLDMICAGSYTSFDKHPKHHRVLVQGTLSYQGLYYDITLIQQ